MDRNGFRNRMKQYKKAREENPGLKYWEWKDIPKYDEGTEGVRDNTYVAPIEKEQVFIPATGTMKFLQEFRKRNPRGGNLEIVSPEFDILTLGRSIGNALYKNLPTDMVYRRTTQSEIDDILESGVFRKLPEGKVAGKGKTFTINGKTVTLHKKGGNAHGGKAFSKGEPWKGTTVTGTADETIVGIPGKGTQWKVGHHGDYSDYIPFENIEKGKGLWEPFNESGIIENVSTKGMRVFRPFTYGYKEDGLLPITGLNLIGENVDQYAEGGQVEPDPLEVLERSRPKVAGIPINDKPLSGTDPLGELYLNLVSGNAVRKAVVNGINGIVRKSFYDNYKELLKAGWNRQRAYNYASPELEISVLPGITKWFDYTIRGANYTHAVEDFVK